MPSRVSLLISRVTGSYFRLSLQLPPPNSAHTKIPKVGPREAEGTANKLGTQEVTRTGLCSIGTQEGEGVSGLTLLRCPAPLTGSSPRPSF